MSLVCTQLWVDDTISLYLAILMLSVFFSNDTATTEIYTLSLHDALPICRRDLLSRRRRQGRRLLQPAADFPRGRLQPRRQARSEEHTSELQSRQYLVCRLLLEKKKNVQNAK